MLTVENLGHEYGRRRFALRNVSFSLEQGYLCCLVGANGAGKTTLLKTIYGVLCSSSGKVSYQGKPVIWPKAKGREYYKGLCRYHKDVAFVGGDDWCFPNETMQKNVQTLKTLYESFDEEEYGRLMEIFGLKKATLEKTCPELSQGQKMLFQIAFALARHPKLLLLDEPFANLDPVVKVDLVQLFQERIKDEGISIIVSTHLVDDVSDMVDYVGLMKEGKLVMYGDRESIFEEKKVDSLKAWILGGEK